MNIGNEIFFDFTTGNDPVPPFCSEELIDSEILPPILSHQSKAILDSKPTHCTSDSLDIQINADGKKPNLNLKSLPSSKRFKFTLIHKTNSDFDLLKIKSEKFNIRRIPNANKSCDEKIITIQNSLLFSNAAQSEPDPNDNATGSSPSNDIISLF